MMRQGVRGPKEGTSSGGGLDSCSSHLHRPASVRCECAGLSSVCRRSDSARERWPGRFAVLAALLLGVAATSSPARALHPSSPQKGSLTGRVIDLVTQEPVREARVEIAGTPHHAVTDQDGTFSLPLEVGTYQVRLSRSGYREQVIGQVVVRSGEATPLDIALSPEGMTLGEVEVKAVGGNGGDEIALLAERKAAAVVSDGLSVREMKRDTHSDAAGVLQRVPGISVVQNKYVYVRGLGERYSTTVLNDALLPTTEPDRRVVPMDLIPANLLDAVTVLKSFTPDQPGEFSGGVVKIRAIEFPPSATLKVSASLGSNSLTTFKSFLTYPGDRLDWLGFGGRRRALPEIIPRDHRLLRGNIIAPGFTAEQLQTFGRAFENIWRPRPDTAGPNQSYSLSGGMSRGRWGLVGGFIYATAFQNTTEDRLYYVIGGENRLVPRSVFARNDFLRQQGLEQSLQTLIPEDLVTDDLLRGYRSSTNTVRLGATVNVAYRLAGNHKLVVRNFFSHEGTDSSRVYRGWYESRATIINDERLRYLEEGIYAGQVSGDHVIPPLSNSVVTWRFTYSRATLDEPDLRESIYEYDRSLGRFRFFSQLQSGLRLFNTMRESIREPALDWSLFLLAGRTTITVKGGASLSNRDRGFTSRRFRFIARGTSGIDFTAPMEELLAPANIRPNGFEIFEETRPTDAYEGAHDIAAGYGMVDVALPKWRIIGGVRAERSRQIVTTFNPFNRTLNPVRADQDQTDWMPSLGLVYSVTPTMNLRAGYSRTVARPHFRELSPFEFTDVTGGPSAVGNPALVRTTITNVDARWEWFVGAQELIAVSFFAKRLGNPIEPVIQPSNEVTIVSYRNVPRASNWGWEIEVRKNLGVLSARLANLSLLGNYTHVRSRVTIGPQNLSVVTSSERPLVGQSKNVFNGIVHYEIPRWKLEARALINFVGERLSEVGAFGLPDIVEEGYPTMDVSVSRRFLGEAQKLEVRFSAENLLDRSVRFVQGPFPYLFYHRGRTFSVGVSYSIF